MTAGNSWIVLCGVTVPSDERVLQPCSHIPLSIYRYIALLDKMYTHPQTHTHGHTVSHTHPHTQSNTQYNVHSHTFNITYTHTHFQYNVRTHLRTHTAQCQQWGNALLSCAAQTHTSAGASSAPQASRSAYRHMRPAPSV